MEIIVMALGGNALLRKGEKPSFEVQMRNARRAAKSIAKVMAERKGTAFAITHGNGPQVGDELLRNIYSKQRLPALPLYILNAETQATIGSILEQTLHEELKKLGAKRKICVIETHVAVRGNDTAFRNPTKPVGPFYSKAELESELKKKRFDFVKVGGSYRRVVPSPQPVEILELDAIESLLKSGYDVISCGGGGIPMVRNGKGYSGADAVIDKDLTAELLASSIKAKEMVILTDVDYVHMPGSAEKVGSIKAKELERILNEFEDGTMKPKITACLRFVKKNRKTARIGNLFKLDKVITGESGTKVSF